MSDTARPKSGGEKLSSNEVNRDLPIVLNGGATLSGATTPVPVYVHTDGELYACDASDNTKLEYIGFVVDDTTDGNSATLQKNGVVSGFTSLTVGSKYYVQDTAGTIGTSKGTNTLLVGTAVSSTQILIQYGSDEYTGTSAFSQDSASSSAWSGTVTMPTIAKYAVIDFQFTNPDPSYLASYGQLIVYASGATTARHRDVSSSSTENNVTASLSGSTITLSLSSSTMNGTWAASTADAYFYR